MTGKSRLLNLWRGTLALVTVYLLFGLVFAAYGIGRLERILVNQDTMLGIGTMNRERLELLRDELRLQSDRHRFLLERVRALERSVEEHTRIAGE